MVAVRGWLPAADRHPAHGPWRITSCRRQAQRLADPGADKPRKSGKGTSQGSPRYGRPLARPAAGRCRSVAELLSVITWCVYDVFWLLSCGFYVSAPALIFKPSVPPGSAPPGILLRRFAYFLSKIPRRLALRVKGPPSATSKQACQQPKNNGGEGDAGRSSRSPRSPHFSDKKETHHD